MKNERENFLVETTTTDGKYADIICADSMEMLIQQFKEIFENADIHELSKIVIEWHV